MDPLPAGWEEARDPNSGRIFYKNHITKSTQWERPGQEPALPHGWEKRFEPNTGRAYYVNHVQKITQWERPKAPSPAASPVSPVAPSQPKVKMQGTGLPPGWTATLDQRTGRTYYSNHITKTTQWERPSWPASAMASPETVAAAGGLGGANASLSQDLPAPSKLERQDSGKVSKSDLYRAVLRAAIIDGVITQKEQAMLSQVREEHNISIDEHDRMLRDMGLDPNEVVEESSRSKADEKECVLCMDAVPDHVVLDCMHMCLCAECAGEIKKSGQKCPVCRGEVRDIKKVY